MVIKQSCNTVNALLYILIKNAMGIYIPHSHATPTPTQPYLSVNWEGGVGGGGGWESNLDEEDWELGLIWLQSRQGVEQGLSRATSSSTKGFLLLVPRSERDETGRTLKTRLEQGLYEAVHALSVRQLTFKSYLSSPITCSFWLWVCRTRRLHPSSLRLWRCTLALVTLCGCIRR